MLASKIKEQMRRGEPLIGSNLTRQLPEFSPWQATTGL